MRDDDMLQRRAALELAPTQSIQRKAAAPIGDRYERIEAARKAREKGGAA
jgi:hypothetical protein